MRIAVTGATGFIGSLLVERLLSDGHRPVVLARKKSDTNSFHNRGVTVITGDVADIDSVSRTVDGCDTVINLARAKAHGAVTRHEVTAVNIDGARNVARSAARAGANLIHASSTAVYGSRISQMPAREDSPLYPDSAYARSKLEGESAVKGELASTTILRISAVLGPRCKSLLSLFRSARDGTLRIVGDGSNVHHPVDVEDVVNAVALCMSARGTGATYNIAGPQSVSMREMVRLMAETAGSTRNPPTISEAIVSVYGKAGALAEKIGFNLPRMESVLFLNGNRSFDISRARNDLGFNPLHDPASAIARTGEWYKSEGML